MRNLLNLPAVAAVALNLVLAPACGVSYDPGGSNGSGNTGNNGGGGTGSDAPGSAASDSINFNYRIGGIPRVFSAKGSFRFDLNMTPANTSMATGWIYPSDPDLYRVVGQHYSTSRVESVSLKFYEVGPGESVRFSTHSDCTFYCPDISMVVGTLPSASNGDYIDYEYVCHVESGTIRTLEARQDRLRGVFSGTGTCLNYESGNDVSFSITDGNFDMPVPSDGYLNLSRKTAPHGVIPSGLFKFEYAKYDRSGARPTQWGVFEGRGVVNWDRAMPGSSPKDGNWAYSLSSFNPNPRYVNHTIYSQQAQRVGEYASASLASFTINSSGEGYADLSLSSPRGDPSSGGFFSCNDDVKIEAASIGKLRIAGRFSGIPIPSSGFFIYPTCHFRNAEFNVPRVSAYEPPF